MKTPNNENTPVSVDMSTPAGSLPDFALAYELAALWRAFERLHENAPHFWTFAFLHAWEALAEGYSSGNSGPLREIVAAGESFAITRLDGPKPLHCAA